MKLKLWGEKCPFQVEAHFNLAGSAASKLTSDGTLHYAANEPYRSFVKLKSLDAQIKGEGSLSGEKPSGQAEITATGQARKWGPFALKLKLDGQGDAFSAQLQGRKLNGEALHWDEIRSLLPDEAAILLEAIFNSKR